MPLHSKVETKTTEGSNMVETTAVGIETELTPIADPGDCMGPTPFDLPRGLP